MQQPESYGDGKSEVAQRKQVAEGLLYAHQRANTNTTKTLEAASFTYALIELLDEKGIISLDELDERKRTVGKRLADDFKDNGMGAMLQDPEQDKYSFADGAEIDCGNRLHLCKAACCRLPFALSAQDVREGIVRWNLGRPYLIEQSTDGYCTHLDRGSCHCNIYESRPVPCRGYDCRTDERVWIDFEKRIPNPALEHDEWPDEPMAQSEPVDRSRDSEELV